jgi:tight adherence protein C
MDVSLIGLFALVFVSVGAAVAAAMWLLTDPKVTQHRLASVAVTPTVKVPESLLADQITPGAAAVRRYLPKSPKDMKKLERQLASAGFQGPSSAVMFSIAQLLTAVLLFFVVMNLLGGAGFIIALIIAAVGYLLPSFWLGRAIEKRKTVIRNGLPDAIDLMIVCIEAGSALDQAIKKVAEELALPYPPLAHELELISAETRAGTPRLEAFRNFANRTKVDDVQSLVAMLVQTDRFGTSIGQALRTHAATSRTKRRQRAEEKAAKLGIKLLVPLIFCLFPAFYVVVLGPAMIRLWRELATGFGVN